MENQEVKWLPVSGFPGYEVSNTGLVRSVDRITVNKKTGSTQKKKGTILALKLHRKYLDVQMTNHEGKRYTKRVNRVVAIAFHPNPNNYPEVNHKDGNKLNNNDWNLEWCTGEMNRAHAIEMKLAGPGELHPNSTLTNEQAEQVRQIYAAGEKTIYEIAKMFKVKHITIYLIVRHRTYKNDSSELMVKQIEEHNKKVKDARILKSVDVLLSNHKIPAERLIDVVTSYILTRSS